MQEPFELGPSPEPVPSGAIEADPVQAMRALYQRIARLERTLDHERQQTREAMRLLLDTLLQVQDQLGETIQRFGVTTSAHEAAIARRTVESAQLLQQALARHKVTPIETVGRPLDDATSVVLGFEHDPNARAGVVLREATVGYRWPHGVIRPARVIVNEPQAAVRRRDKGEPDSHSSQQR